jgi:hypothetical protein
MDPNNAQQDKREVRLEGERLERARRHMTLAQEELMSLADIVLITIGSEHAAEEEIRVSINVNAEVDPSGPRGCGSIMKKIGGVFVEVGSYQDPPGVCTTEPCP